MPQPPQRLPADRIAARRYQNRKKFARMCGSLHFFYFAETENHPTRVTNSGKCRQMSANVTFLL